MLKLATIFSALVVLAQALPSIESGPLAGQQAYSVAQRHARSSLTKKNECWHNDDCPTIPNSVGPICNPQTLCCDVVCKSGYENVWGQCHAKKQQSQKPSAPSTSNNGCPSGKRLFNGVCVSAPGSALSPKRQCNTDNDCTSGKGHAFATCQNGACSIVCFQGYKYNGKYCAIDRQNPGKCTQGSCVNGPAGSHLIGVCQGSGRCTAVCEEGYVFGEHYRCHKKSPDTCKSTTCARIVGGVSSCSNGTCSYVCSDINKVPVLKPGGAYVCENQNTNPQCCGTDCKRCPNANSAYSGLSHPVPACHTGTCGFRCPRGSLKTDASGRPYCG